MKNRTKNIYILAVLILFLLMIELIPVTCIFKQVTGIYCPACGMTRAFHSILELNFIDAFRYNILSFPLFIFLLFSSLILSYEIFTNKFQYIPKLLKTLSNKFVILTISIFLLISLVLNNISSFY